MRLTDEGTVQKGLEMYRANQAQRMSESAKFLDEIYRADVDPLSVDPRKILDKIRTRSDPEFREFDINLAMMLHFLAGVPKSNAALRERLTARAIGYLHKYSSFRSGAALGWQSNPVQNGRRAYARFGTYSLMDRFRDGVAESFALPPENLRIVSDQHFLAAVKRHLVSWNWQNVADPMPLPEDNPATISQVLARLESNDAALLFIDCSESIAGVLAQLGNSPKELGPAINALQLAIQGAFREGVRRKVESEHAKLPNEGKEAKIKALIELVDRNVLVGGMLNYGHLPLFYTGKFTEVDKAQDLKGASGQPVPLKPEQQSVFKTLIEENGFTPDPVQLLECSVRIKDSSDEILRRCLTSNRRDGFSPILIAISRCSARLRSSIFR
jgi:hypothetical protein